VFPELSLMGYVPLKGYDQEHKRRLFQLAQRCAEDHLASLVRLTAGRRAAVVVGFMEPSEMRHEMHNSVALLQDGAILAVHRKLHLPVEENHYFIPGDEATVVDCRIGRVGLGVCYDIVFPEAARLAALRGAEVFLVPSNWADTSNLVQYGETFPVARALEEQMHIVFVNGVGESTFRGHRFRLYGGSRIVSASGSVLATAGQEETTIDAKLTLQDLAEAAGTFPILRDRRPHIYGDLVASPARFSALTTFSSRRRP
jgi:N-carbamoylputrescine amidase